MYLDKAVMKVKSKQRSSHSWIFSNSLFQNRHDYLVRLRARELVEFWKKTTTPAGKSRGQKRHHYSKCINKFERSHCVIERNTKFLLNEITWCKCMGKFI